MKDINLIYNSRFWGVSEVVNFLVLTFDMNLKLKSHINLLSK